jgi:uncharacterized protein (TIGR00369 family)
MNKKESTIKLVNSRSPKFISMLGGQLVDFDIEKVACTFEFDISKDFCHSIDIVQGGFVTAMLDAAMSHAIFMFDQEVVSISSLEIKTSYLAPTRAGKLRVEGWAIERSYKIVFMEGRVYDHNNELTATASSVAKIGRLPK